MCSVSFSNTGSNFRELVNKAAKDQVISQPELADLSKNATSDEEKNFVAALQSKANLQDLKVSKFDPSNSIVTFNVEQNTTTNPETAPAKSTSSTEKPPEPERVNLITPLIGAIGLLLGALSGAAPTDELFNAVNNSLTNASDSISKHGIKTPIVGTIKEETDTVGKHKKMAEGK